MFDYIRVLGRWLIGREEGSLLQSLARQYDRTTVAQERLLLVRPDGTLVPLAPEGLTRYDGRPIIEKDRLLLIIHGTFSSTASPVSGLGAEFLRWAYERYAAVIGYDHWTLSKSPEENAAELWTELEGASKHLPRGLRDGRRIDAITHSRGGLVARALVELAGRDTAVRHVAWLLQQAGNLAVDAFFDGDNDLVVNTSHVWAVDARPRLDRLSDWWPADRLLVFTPSLDGGRRRHRLPRDVIEIRQAGVHHTAGSTGVIPRAPRNLDPTVVVLLTEPPVSRNRPDERSDTTS